MKRKISIGDIVQHKKFSDMRGYVYIIPPINGNGDPMGCYWIALEVCPTCHEITKTAHWFRESFKKIKDGE